VLKQFQNSKKLIQSLRKTPVAKIDKSAGDLHIIVMKYLKF